MHLIFHASFRSAREASYAFEIGCFANKELHTVKQDFLKY
jgi:hypothetical protein